MIYVSYLSPFLSAWQSKKSDADGSNLFSAFSENVVIIANPSKSGGDWWYGKNVSTGESGLFPKTYVEVIRPCESFFLGFTSTILSYDLTFSYLYFLLDDYD